MNDEIVIKLENISKKYNLYNNKKDRLKEALHPLRKKYHKDFYALKNLNLEIKRGEIFGIVGKNGSGKSTLLKIISGILTPTSGSLIVKGNIVPLLELGAGFNPEFTGMENIYFYCSLLGFNKDQTDKLVDKIINFAELEEFINQPLKTYSSGMKARLAFAVSINVDPDILILDEVLSVGDELFKRKCYAKMEEFFKGGKTILFVTHNAYTIIELCTRTILINDGEVILDGGSKIVTQYYQKLLYAQGDNKSSVKKEIENLFADSKCNSLEKLSKKNLKDDLNAIISGSKNDYLADEINNNPFYIPDFKPKSTFITKNFDINIYDYTIKTTEGNVVNSLITGEEYILSFKIKSHQTIENVVIGTRIKNEQGLVLFGIRYNAIDAYTSTFITLQKDQTYNIEFRFKCNLLKGNYYFDLGTENFINNIKNVVMFIEDALVVKVNGQYNNHQWGFLNINPIIQISTKID